MIEFIIFLVITCVVISIACCWIQPHENDVQYQAFVKKQKEKEKENV